MNILRRIQRSREFWFVICTSFLFFVLRFPSLFEPLWYGDEGIYQVIGTSLNNGKLLYREIFDNKPPLLYWLYSFFDSDQFAIRLASLIGGLLSIVIFYFLSKKLFKNNNNIHYLTTLIFAILYGLPIFEGNIANAENFMLLPILASSFLIVTQKRFFIAGVLLGIAFLFKIVAIFDFSAFLVFCFILNFNSIKKYIKLFNIFIGFSLPIVLVALFFITNNAFVDFIKATFITNISYVSYANKIGNIPFLLFAKLILLGGFIFYIFKRRKKINETTLFIFIWFGFSIFNTFFSQRPYSHYVLVLLPALCLMIGLVLFERNKKIIAIFLIITLLAIIKVFGIPNFKKNINYYQNFISYLKNDITTTSYQTFFDRNTPVDYEVALFIKPKLGKDDTIFVWGNNAQLYQLTDVVAPTKYVVAYHISSYSDGVINTINAIEASRPKYIVVMHNIGPIPFPLINYSKKININTVEIYERIF